MTTPAPIPDAPDMQSVWVIAFTEDDVRNLEGDHPGHKPFADFSAEDFAALSRFLRKSTDAIMPDLWEVLAASAAHIHKSRTSADSERETTL